MAAPSLLVAVLGAATAPSGRSTTTVRQSAHRLAHADRPTVWGEFGALALDTGAVNLGQGFPDWDPPEFVLESARKALTMRCHQYTRTAGDPALTQVLAQRYSRHFGREVDADTEIAITVGASQALFLALQSLVNEGDEVVLLEPAFDLYYGQIGVAGGTAVGVPMSLDVDGQWQLDADQLRAALTERSRILILNSPHNPTGKVFSLEEMDAIAAVVREHPSLVVISDEVYKYIVHGAQAEHHHFANIDGMAGRTLTVSSAGACRAAFFPRPLGDGDAPSPTRRPGKTFSVTGWQVGWCVGPPSLIQPIQRFLPYTQFCVAAPMQQALAIALSEADLPLWNGGDYYTWLQDQYAGKRDELAQALVGAGIRPLPCEGGFFMMGDISQLDVPEAYLLESTAAAPVMTPDWAACRYLAKEHGVLMIPSSPFFSPANKHVGASLVRIAFCKRQETLRKASACLAAMAAARMIGA